MHAGINSAVTPHRVIIYSIVMQAWELGQLDYVHVYNEPGNTFQCPQNSHESVEHFTESASPQSKSIVAIFGNPKIICNSEIE